MLADGDYGKCQLKLLEASYAPVYRGGRRARQRAGFKFSAAVHDENGSRIGRIERKIYTDSHGRIVVNNSYMALVETATGKGYGKSVTSGLENIYRRNNVHRMELRATKRGGYAWAQADYRLNPRASLREESLSPTPAHLMDAVDYSPSIGDRINAIYDSASSYDKALLDSMRDRFNGPANDCPSPQELANLSGTNPRLGETMMTGATWHGVKIL